MIWQVSRESFRGWAKARPRAPGMESGEVEAYDGSANTILHALGQFFLNPPKSNFLFFCS